MMRSVVGVAEGDAVESYSVIAIGETAAEGLALTQSDAFGFTLNEPGAC